MNPIGIHIREKSFSDRWVDYCCQHQIPFTRVDCLRSDIVEQCSGLSGLLWHWTLNDARELLVARQIVAALEEIGLPLFPNLQTCWHYDDKLGQKYLLEAIEAPLIPTWIFTDRSSAESWVDQAEWPKVFKLRCGAGSNAVRLIRSRNEARALITRAFGRGFASTQVRADEIRKYIRARQNPKDLLRRGWRLARKAALLATRGDGLPRQKGYFYCQEFLPDNDFDTRVTIIGRRAFAFTRGNRPGDFRASGSGRISYDLAKIDVRCVRVAFEVARRLRTQSLAFDFLFDARGQPAIGEISYCYMAGAVYACPGHWDEQMEWREGHTWPQDAILEDMLAETNRSPGSKSRADSVVTPVHPAATRQ